MTRYTLTILLGASLGAGACADTIDGNPTPPGDPPPSGTTTGGDDTTFDHDNNSISVWDLIDRLTKEGPPSFSSQMHGCTKLKYATLGNVLTSVGITRTGTAPPAGQAPTAGYLYTSGGPSLGAANYATRVRENISITTSGASRTFDIFAAGATEVITKAMALPRCAVGGVAPVLFDASNKCHAEGIECIIGVPATQGHVELCDLTVSRASTPEIGKQLAVAAMLAAAYTCE